MKHTVVVAKAIKKGDKITAFEDVQEVASNRAFGFNRRGYVTVQPDQMDLATKALEAQAKAEAKRADKVKDATNAHAAGPVPTGKKAVAKKSPANKKAATKKPTGNKAAKKKAAKPKARA